MEHILRFMIWIGRINQALLLAYLCPSPGEYGVLELSTYLVHLEASLQYDVGLKSWSRVIGVLHTCLCLMSWNMIELTDIL